MFLLSCCSESTFTYVRSLRHQILRRPLFQTTNIQWMRKSCRHCSIWPLVHHSCYKRNIHYALGSRMWWSYWFFYAHTYSTLSTCTLLLWSLLTPYCSTSARWICDNRWPTRPVFILATLMFDSRIILLGKLDASYPSDNSDSSRSQNPVKWATGIWLAAHILPI